MSSDPPKLLLIDSYDSFTHNLASLCRQSIPNCYIYIIKNDDFTLSELLPYLGYFSAIIVGPGPGSPDHPLDIGVVKDLWKVSDEYLIPIFGVCLGLQSLAIEFGASLKRLSIVKHGQISLIQHEGIEIFKGVGEVNAVRYHSLHVELAKDGEVEELAWANDGVDNGKVVMAVKHTTKPFWAVQYHPESVCTKGGGSEVLRNFWRLATNWSRSSGRTTRPWDEIAARFIGYPWPHFPAHSPPPSPRGSTPAVLTRILNLPDLSTVTIADLFGVSKESSPFVLLDSAAQPGRFSIIGSLLPASPLLSYYVGDKFVRIAEGKSYVDEELGPRDIWSWLASFMRGRKARGGSPEIPFWGGLVGYLSYELGVTSLSVPFDNAIEGEKNKRHPDVNLVFVERSVVLDSLTGKVYIQSIIPHDDDWVEQTVSTLTDAVCIPHDDAGYGNLSSQKRRRTAPASHTVVLPDKTQYISRINQAKEHLFAGDSYEICLTAQTRVTVRKPSYTSGANLSTSWDLFKTLRRNNPAPHSAYIRLHPTTLLSSSPERFLSFSRPPRTTCQLRPIKGTVRKGPGITRAVAEKALIGSVKEVAENLMIVDLIRHDLHGVVGENVEVKQFCRVEEYETVWQLVSVIEGRAPSHLDGPDLDGEGELGWEVLRNSLPPGSMTGAPKKRSVQILQSLEDDNRGVYSGVLGYWCVGGGGDWSVIIRSCFKHDLRYVCPRGDGSIAHDANTSETDTENWIIGAGGAITALSDAEAEWDEMLVKLQSALRAFGITADAA